MMNDRFSVELRQHLIATADERPADGRLAAVVEGVALTGQRHPLVARLAWAPARIGQWPPTSVRYGLIAAALIIALVGAALVAGVAPPRRTVFEGTWTSIDPADGSRQTLVVGAGTSPAVRFDDAVPTGLACRADAVDGTGTVVDDRLRVQWPDSGGCGFSTVRVGLGTYTYDQATDAITDGDKLTWARDQASVVRPSIAPVTEPSLVSPSPSTSPPPTPHPGEATFTSAIHGFSMGVPPGWQTRPATEPWRGERLDYDSPAADVIFDPRYGKRLYLLVASQSFSGMSEDDWRREVLAWTCPNDHHEMWSWRVDGAYSWQQGPCNSGSIIRTDTRGYLIRLVVSSNELPGDHWDWLKPVLETVDLRPEDAIDPKGAAKPVPQCSDIASGATYSNRFGSPTLSATVPVGAVSSWQGYRDDFMLGSTCPFGEPIKITASIVDHVNNLDACSPWTGDETRVTSPTEAAEGIVAQQGHKTSPPTEVTIAGISAIRLEISAQGSLCPDGIIVWLGNEFGAERDEIVYLVGVGRSTLGIAVAYTRSLTTPAQLAEAEAIVASIRIEP